jgi:hypothetical protein
MREDAFKVYLREHYSNPKTRMNHLAQCKWVEKNCRIELDDCFDNAEIAGLSATDNQNRREESLVRSNRWRLREEPRRLQGLSQALRKISGSF